MSKKLILFLMLTVTLGSAIAAPVGMERARRVAANFAQKGGMKFITKDGMKEISNQTLFEEFYIFTGPNGKGFVLVSKDDRVVPILAYSDENEFDADNIPEHVAAWLRDYDRQIQFYREHDIKPSPEITEKWDQLENGGMKTSGNLATTVAPLLNTTWHQWSGQLTSEGDSAISYNYYCPKHGTSRTLTGCVATSVAQIMNYWKWPAHGRGTKTYTYNSAADYNGGSSAYTRQLSLSFDTCFFNWDLMPTSVRVNNAPLTPRNQVFAVAKLMYSAGVAVEMVYGTTFSGAYLFQPGSMQFQPGSLQTTEQYPAADVALRNNFYYKYTTSGVLSRNFTNSEWIALLKMELNAGRPLIYGGNDPESGGHAFILDGYNTSDQFHVNWGWGGNYDGYFAIGQLNPNENTSYNNSNMAIIGIEPAATMEPDDGVTTVVATSNNPAYGSVTGSGTYGNYSDMVILRATANSGYKFIGWSDGNRDNPRCQRANGGTQTYTAIFAEDYAGEPGYVYYYDDAADNRISRNNTITEWGIRIPYSMVSNMESLDSVIFMASGWTTSFPAGQTYTVKVYTSSGSATAPGTTPLFSQVCDVVPVGQTRLFSIPLSTPLAIDHTNQKDIWITLSSTNCIIVYKIGSSNDYNEHWYKINNNWSNIPDAHTNSFPYYIKAHFVPQAPASIAPPSGVNVSNVTPNGALVSWTAPSDVTPSSYAVAYGQGLIPDALERVSSSTTSVSLSGLSNNTHYNVFVKSRYANGSESEWTGPVSFYTHDANITDPVVVTTMVNHADWGTVVGGGVYQSGSTVTLEAVAMPGFQFSYWGDDVASNSNPLSISPTEDVTYLANFEPVGCTLTVSSNDDALGSVSVEGESQRASAGALFFPYLSSVCLTATPTATGVFKQWDDSITTNPRYCTVTGDISRTAIFEPAAGGSKVFVNNDQRSLSLSVIEAAPVSIFDMLGRCVYSAQANPGSQYHVTLPYAGVYIIRIGNNYAEKIVIR